MIIETFIMNIWCPSMDEWLDWREVPRIVITTRKLGIVPDASPPCCEGHLSALIYQVLCARITHCHFI